MTKSKKGGSYKSGKGESVKCPHLHFKEDIIDRNVISKQQYLDLLCTPKGYRWQIGDGEPKQFEEVMAKGPRKVVCSGRRLRKPERTYVHNFLAEVWALLTPEMVDRLKGMLMNEFGMTPEEANSFLQDQAELMENGEQKKDKVRRKENGCNEEGPMYIGKYLQRQFENIMNDELEEILLSMMCGPRSKRNVDLSEKILENMTDVVGEKCTLQTPKTQQQRIMVFLADQLGKWLLEIVDEADLQLVKNLENKLEGLDDDGGKGDVGDETSDEDIEIITKKKMPKGWKDFMNKADAKGDAKGDDEGDAQPKKKKEEKPQKKSKVEDEKKEPRLPQEKKTVSRRSSKKTIESQPPSSQKKETVVSKSKQSVAQKRETIKSKEPSRTGTSRSDYKPKRPPSQPPKSKSGSTESQPTTERLPPRSISRTSKSPQPRPRSSSQARRDLLKKMIGDHISSVVMEQDSKVASSRLEALKDVISKRLEEKLVPSHTDPKTIDAIKEVTGLISTYVDHVTTKVELEYGNKTPATNLVPVSQRGVGPVYAVKRAGSALALSTLTHTQAKVRVNLARGLPPPKSAPNEFKQRGNMIKWSGDVADMAENWNKWIGSTVKEAVQIAENQRKGIKQDKQLWKEWKDTTGEEALEWRRNKKLVDTQAKQLQNGDKVTKS